MEEIAIKEHLKYTGWARKVRLIIVAITLSVVY